MGLHMYIDAATFYVRERRVSLGICSFFSLVALWSGIKAAQTFSLDTEFVPGLLGFFAVRAIMVGIILLLHRKRITAYLCALPVFILAVAEGLYLGGALQAANDIFYTLALSLSCVFPKYVLFTLAQDALFRAAKEGFHRHRRAFIALLIADILIVVLSCAVM